MKVILKNERIDLGNEKALERVQSKDLSKGQKDGLKQHGVSESDFDRMSSRNKAEWLEELELDAYENVRKMK